MARRNDHSREELRSMVLKAGREIVTEHGVNGLTTREVAKRIGYSPGTLYLIFHNVDDLKFALNVSTLIEIRTRINENIRTISDPEERLLSMAAFYLDFGLASPGLWRLMFEHQLPGDNPMPEAITKETDVLFAIAAKALRELVPAMPAAETDKVTASFWAALHGVAHLVITEKLSLAHVGSAHDVVDVQMQLLLTGVKDRSWS